MSYLEAWGLWGWVRLEGSLLHKQDRPLNLSHKKAAQSSLSARWINRMIKFFNKKSLWWCPSPLTFYFIIQNNRMNASSAFIQMKTKAWSALEQRGILYGFNVKSIIHLVIVFYSE
jgi:hypothetical protein